jgi:hypothetical protein
LSRWNAQGALYVDWFKAQLGEGISTSQLSTRVRMEAGAAPGKGWRALLDVRDQLNRGSADSHRFILYDARLVRERPGDPLKLQLGQMNLYDSAGAGQLLGGVATWRRSEAIAFGGYAGFEPEIYGLRLSSGYRKYGAFARYDGPEARSVSVSYNGIRFGGRTERAFLYSSGLLPAGPLNLYGNLEYELTSFTPAGDRLSRVFLNARYTFTETVDLTGHYSSGKGLDYHRFLLDASRDPSLRSSEIERFYYNRSSSST